MFNVCNWMIPFKNQECEKRKENIFITYGSFNLEIDLCLDFLFVIVEDLSSIFNDRFLIVLWKLYAINQVYREKYLPMFSFLYVLKVIYGTFGKNQLLSHQSLCTDF